MHMTGEEYLKIKGLMKEAGGILAEVIRNVRPLRDLQDTADKLEELRKFIEQYAPAHLADTDS